MTYTHVTITIDQISFQLQEKHDFEWLQALGEVFCVFDQQDSGNICFGIEQNGVKKFVKYAGAKTMEYEGDPQEAIKRLKNSITLYDELRHPYLIKLLKDFPVEHGYVSVFEWFTGECLHSHWSYPPPGKYTDPKSPFYRFKQLPVEVRLASIDRIFQFHAYVEKQNYVAVDFYDGSILYDFSSNETMICDIDLYEKKPFFNKMGRLWGSSRFMSPEEFTLGAKIDARTNVFNMGAIAFGLIGGELDRSFERWDGSKALFDVAVCAVEKNRAKRYASVGEFLLEWNQACNKSTEVL